MKISGSGDFDYNKLIEKNNVNPFGGSEQVQSGNNSEKTEAIAPQNGVKGITKEEGAASAGVKQGEPLLDRSQFTNENDIQEVNLNEFEDDFR